MRQLNNRGRRSGTYVLKFVGTAALLTLGTLVLVLYVLPERYVLSSGFREGNLNLPNPRVPFEPAPPLRIAAIPDIPRGGPGDVTPPADSAGTVPRGPAELFWERVRPLLEAGRHREAIPLFTDYLNRHPGDLGIRREYAITLAAAGFGDEAIPILRGLLDHEDDPALHLLLARTLRDEGRIGDASRHYGIVLERRPDDVELVLEWARALSWISDHQGAAALLSEASERQPDNLALRAELIRVLSYKGDLREAQDLLNTMSDLDIRRLGLEGVRDDLTAWLSQPPDSVTVEPPSLLEQALQAREADELERADSLFQASVAEDPRSAEAWTAYADFLQYEREDFEGALEALRRVEDLREDEEPALDPALQYRMAQLEIWTDRTAEAHERLERLLAALERGAGAPADSVLVPEAATRAPTRADVLSLIGDLHRWNGERLPAVRRYRAALDDDPEHPGALEGLGILRAEVDRQLAESEQPGIGAVASGFADTDEFRRYQAGGAWSGLHDVWTWSTRTGGRWLEGFEPGGGLGSREGLFAELDGARWWRWGTVRTGVHLSMQNVRSNSLDVGLAASARLLGDLGRRTDVRVAHEPAFEATGTLQSVATRVWQTRVNVAHSEPLSDRWTGAVTAEAARLDHRDLAGSDVSRRLQLALSAGRTLSPVFTVGMAGRALRYDEPAPTVAATLPGGAPLRLYWDPELSVSVGPYLTMRQPLTPVWYLTARASPGVAFIRERAGGTEAVPDLSARLGLALEGSRYRSAVEFFYGQGRFNAYRSYGFDLSFSARGFLGPGFDGS